MRRLTSAVAFIYGTATNTTESIISSNAVIDASATTTINATTSYPLLQDSPVNNFNPTVLLGETDLRLTDGRAGPQTDLLPLDMECHVPTAADASRNGLNHEKLIIHLLMNCENQI